MTSIWNNFEGTYDQLERYEDVITALGAATASSSEEIAGGLQQFASIAQTVGLSYEYATSALATVVATTRQSESVVGTAFKTIFSRLQGLSLGDTLDDGTDLNKYSTALHKVGVEILDTEGNMKDLDTILDDLAAKWDVLTTAQKTALAQTVAGTRQYNQLIALMDNWDFMEENLATAENSEGALQEQADIYAGSWEAARKRVQAAMQGIYDQLLDDQAFIKITDSIATMVNAVGDVIDAIGGLKGVLSATSVLALKLFGSDISKSLNDFVYNIQLGTAAGQKAILETRNSFANATTNLVDSSSISGSAVTDAYKKQGEIQAELIAKTDQLHAKNKDITTDEQTQLNLLMDINRQLAENLKVSTQQLQDAQSDTANLQMEATAKNRYTLFEKEADQSAPLFNDDSEYRAKVKELIDLQEHYSLVAQIMSDFDAALNNDSSAVAAQTAIKQLCEQINQLDLDAYTSIEEVGDLQAALENLQNTSSENINVAFLDVMEALSALGGKVGDDFANLRNAITGTDEKSKRLRQTLIALEAAAKKSGQAMAAAAEDNASFNQSVITIQDRIASLQGTVQTTADRIVSLGSAFGSLSMVTSSISGIANTLSSPDTSSWEKFVSILGSVGLLVPTLTTTMSQLNKAFGAESSILSVVITSYHSFVDKIKQKVAAQAASNAYQAISNATQKQAVATIFSEIAARKLDIASMNEATIAQEVKNIVDKNNIVLTDESLAAIIKRIASLKSEAVATASATAAQNAFNTSLLAFPGTWIVLALGAVVAGYKAYTSYCKQAAEATETSAKSIISTNQEKQSEIDANEELITSYRSLVAAYEDGTATRTEVADGVEELCKKYDIEDGKVLALTGHYEELGRKIRGARLDELTVSDDTAKDSVNKALDGAQAAAAGDTEKSSTTPSVAYGGEGALGDEDTTWWEKIRDSISTAFTVQAANASLSVGDAEGYQSLIDSTKGEQLAAGDISNASGVLEYYEDLEKKKKEAQEASRSSTVTDEEKAAAKEKITLLNEEIEKYSEYVDAINDSATTLAENAVERSYYENEDTFKNPTSYEDFSTQYDAAVASAKSKLIDEMGLTEDTDAYDAALANAKTYFSDLIGAYDEATEYFSQKTIIDSLTQSFKENNSDIDIEQWLANNIYNDGDRGVRVAAYLDFSGKESQDELDAALKQAQAKEEEATRTEKLNLFDTAKTEINSDDGLSDETAADLKEQYADLYSFEEEGSVRQMQLIKEVANAELAGVVENKNAQKAANDEKITALQQQKAELQSLIDKADKGGTAAVNIDVEELTEAQARVEELEAEINSLTDENFEIQLTFNDEITNQLTSMGDNIISFSDQIKTATDCIGENFTVAAEDVRTLANTFPELLVGAENGVGGVLTLNKELVQQTLQGDAEVLQSDKETLSEKIKNQISLLESQLKTVNQQLNIADQLASGEISLDEAKNLAMANGMSDYSEFLDDSYQAWLTDSDTVNSSMAMNQDQLTASMVEDINAIAEAWTQVWSAQETGSYTKVTAPGSSYSGNTSFSGTASDIQADIQTAAKNGDTSEANAASKAYGEALKAALEQQKENLTNNIADLQASLSEIESATTEGIDSINNAASGKGNDSSKKSGSSGSGKKESDPKTKDKEKRNDDEPELYHEIKEAIKDVEHELTKLDKAQEHMYGGELIASLKQENALLSQQRANYAELNSQIEARQEVLRQNLAEYGDPEDYYGMFNSIQESYNAAVDAYNELVEAYNNMTAAEQEAYESTLDAAKTQLELDKARYDKMQGYLTEYYTNKESLRSNDEKQQELLYQQIENNLEAYETEIQLKLDATEAERSLAKFLRNMKQDIKNLYKTSAEWADEFALSKTNAETYATDVQTRIDQLNKYKSIYASGDWGNESSLFASESEALQAIVDTENQLLEDSENLFEEYKDAYQNLLDALSEIGDQFDDIMDDFEAIDDTLDHYEKIIEMLHGTTTDQGMQELSQLYDTQVKSSLAQQSSLRDYIQALQKAKADALAMGYEEDDEYVINIQQEIDEKNQELEDTIEAYLDTIQAQLENSVNMAKSVMDKAIWGNSIDNVQQEWDDKKAQAEGYYDEVERIYQLENLESKWQSAINDADSLKTQQQLQEIMEAQVAALENKTALSEKDIELAQKEIEVYQAQIALEEAQNAKDSMKLTRDEAGNWSYQYVADEDNVAANQQNYIDKLNEWRSAAMTATEEIKESVLTAYTEFTDRMTEIMEDVTMSDEERAAAIEELNETYWGEEGIITLAVEDSNYLQREANEATFLELQGLYAADPEYYAQMTEAEKALIDDLRDQGITDYQTLRDYVIGSDGQSGAYGEILERAQDVNKQCSEAWDSMAADAITQMYGKDGKLDKNSVTGVVATAYATMQQALAYYDQAVHNSEVASGIEWSQVQNQLANVSSSIDGVTARVGNVINQIGGLQNFAYAVLQIATAWNTVANQIRQATADLATYLSLLTGSTITVGDAVYGDTGSGTSGTPTASTPSNDNTPTPTGDGTLGVGDTATLTGNYYYTSQGATPLGNRYSGVENGVVVDMVNDKYGDYSYHIHSADGVYQDLGWVKKNQLSGYATGGYTGEWNGGDGRLALLHSKELVLNQSDTENLLSAVSAVRDMSNLGSSIASSVASGVANLVRDMLGMTANGSSSIYGGSTSDATNNNFEITMNVDGGNVEEIKSAILSLPTLASQYLSRRSI